MFINLKKHILLLLFTLISFSNFSQYQFEKLNLRMHKFVKENELAGIQTLIIKDDKIINFDTYGYSNIKENKKLQSNSIFRIASMTKCVVSVGLMKLYDKGLFSLEDPIEKFLPEFKNMHVFINKNTFIKAQNSIRIIDILRHTTGIGKTSPYLNEKLEELKKIPSIDLQMEINRLSKIPLSNEPGTVWRYSPATNIAGLLIEKISGKSLDIFLKDEIFDPLGMKDTFFQVPKDKIDRFTTGYTINDQQKLIEIDNPLNSTYTKRVTFFIASGGLVSSILDYSNFCKMLLNNGEYNGIKILQKNTVKLMTTNQLNGIKNAKENDNNPKPNNSLGFGLGFNVLTDISKYPIAGNEGSYGWHGSWGSYFKIDPKENLIMILMTQMKPWKYYNKEIFESLVYDAIKTPVNQ